MILLCSGQISSRHFDAMLLFALQLERRGHQVAIDHRFLPDEISKQNQYEMAPFLAESADISPDRVLIIGADEISEDVQILLGAMALDSSVPIWALGQFTGLQNEINARNRIAYATGREPHLLRPSGSRTPDLFSVAISPLVTAIADEPDQTNGKTARVLVYLPCEDLEQDDTFLNHLSVIDYSPNMELHLLTNAKGKDLIRKSRHAALSVFSYGELPPNDLLHYFDVIVFFGPNVPGERMALLALNAMGAGKVVIDSTASTGFASSGAPALKGPTDPSVLSGYLHNTISKNRVEIGTRTQQNAWLRQRDIATLERDLGLDQRPAPMVNDASRSVFFPTNGNGVGHAQRCALIAEASDPDLACCFAAFPSCVDLLHKRGFSCLPMVPRSGDHSEEYAADVLNYLRLRNFLQAGDQLIFDGGYVFDSVYRVISKLRMPAVWIRRGLWRPGQVNPIALERERAFSKIIVPVEAFAELNTDYSSGDHVRKVGPIVRQGKLSGTEIESLRDRLSIQFDKTIDTLVVTMLGGGVASERTAQVQLLCSTLERRSNCLHLVVAWPNAVVSNGLFGWKNTHVVHTMKTLDLCQAADLTVSATGYNSFHELLYAHVPAIFIPQSAPYLDDQERRARAASERGLASFVQDTDLLDLERQVTAFLDQGKAHLIRKAMAAETLPEAGNVAAAQLIQEGVMP